MKLEDLDLDFDFNVEPSGKGSKLKALKDMGELKAEQMLSILTAAETEMYESSKKNEETQQL